MRMINTEAKRVLLFSLVFLFSLGLVGEAVSAIEYYVSTTGSDITGDGSFGNPWQTINHTQYNVGAYDTIYIAAGEYPENADIIFNPPEGTTWSGAGVSTKLFTMGLYNNDFVITNDFVTISHCKIGMGVCPKLVLNNNGFTAMDCQSACWFEGSPTNLYFEDVWTSEGELFVVDFYNFGAYTCTNCQFNGFGWQGTNTFGYFRITGTGNSFTNMQLNSEIGWSDIFCADATFSNCFIDHEHIWGSSGNSMDLVELSGSSSSLTIVKDASADGQQSITNCIGIEKISVDAGASLSVSWYEKKFFETSNNLWTTITSTETSLVVAGGSSDVVFTERPLAITPSNTLDMLVTTWQTSGDYIKKFNASCATPAATFTYTIGDMPIDTNVQISTNMGWAKVHTTDGSGQFTGTYDGGWSEKVFTVGLLDETAFSDLNYTSYVDVGDNSTVIRINASNPSNVSSVWIEENSTQAFENSSMALESGTNVSGIYNYSLNCSSLGEISFRIYADDSYGQLANTSAYAIFVQDISVSIGSDRSVYGLGENITVSGKAVLLPDGTNLTGNNITIYLNGTELLYNATTGLIEENGNETLSTDAGGNYTYIISAQSQEGDHTIKVNLTDSNGIYGENETVFGVDITPLNITIISPGNTTALPAGTTQVWINITTDKNAVCRYNATDADYENSTNFTSTGGTNHSFLYTGLSNGNTYNLYYWCNDTNGNINTNSTYHTFSVSVQSTYCGDGLCNGGETCSSCPFDCGSCGSGSNWIFIHHHTDENETNETNMSIIEPMIDNMTDNTTIEQDLDRTRAKEKIDEVKSGLRQYDEKAKEKIIEAETAFSNGDYEDAYKLAVEAERLFFGMDTENATDDDTGNSWIVYLVLFSLLAVVLYVGYTSAPEIIGKLKAGIKLKRQ